MRDSGYLNTSGFSRTEKSTGFLLLVQLLAWRKLAAQNEEVEDRYHRFLDGKDRVSELTDSFSFLGKNIPGFKHPPFPLHDPKEKTEPFLARIVNTAKEIAIDRLEFEALYRDYCMAHASQHYQNVYPRSLIELFLSFWDVEQFSKVYAPYWSDPFALCFMARRTKTEFNIENLRENPLFYLLPILFEDANFNFEVNDPLKEPAFQKNYMLTKFDATIAIPPFGLRQMFDGSNDVFNRFSPASKVAVSMEIPIIEHILAQTAKKALIVLPTGVLFKTTSREIAFREMLIKRGIVSSVFSIPGNMFLNTGINTHLVVMDLQKKQDHVTFVDTSSLVKRNEKTRRNEFDHVSDIMKLSGESKVKVERSQLEKEGHYSLDVNRYVMDADSKALLDRLSKFETTTLKDIAEIIRPQAVRSNRNREGQEFFEIAIKHLPEYGFVDKKSVKGLVSKWISHPIELEKVRRLTLKPFDVLLGIKGSIGKLGILGDIESEDWIASQTFAVLRVKKDLGRFSPRNMACFLAAFLKSEIGGSLLGQVASGSTIPFVTARNLEQLRIPVPEAELIDQAAKIFDTEIQIRKEISSLEEKLESLRKDFL